MPYSCTVLCGLLPCVNLVYPVKIFIKVHVTSPAPWLLSALRHTHSLTHSLTCSFPQDNLWRRRSSWFWDDRLWRHCSQSGRRRLISVLVVHFVWARANVCLITNFGDMWRTLTISVCTLWLGLFWTLGGWWSPQPSHPAGTVRWRVVVVVHHQHREQNVKYTAYQFVFGISTLVKHMKTAYVVCISQDKLLSPNKTEL